MPETGLDTNKNIQIDNVPPKRVRPDYLYYIKRYILFKMLFPLVYKLHAIKPMDEKLVIFASFRSKELSGNLKHFYDEVAKRGYKTKSFLRGSVNKIKSLQFALQFTKCFARAKCVVVDDYFPPLYANMPRKGQKIVQLWHGAGAFKKWGYATADKSWGLDKDVLEKFPIHNNYTHVIVSSEEVIPHYQKAFNIKPDVIFPLGFPRSDVFFDAGYIKESREQLERIFPEARGKKVILYAPTFRGSTATSAANENKIDYKAFYENFHEDHVFITKFHPFVESPDTNDKAYPGFLMDVTNLLEINSALCAADILITDYSSLIFEYALLERPMVFFAYDLDEYIDARDFFYSYDELVPGPIAKDNPGLINAVREVEKSFPLETIRAFKAKFMSACDGQSTKRIVDEVLKS